MTKTELAHQYLPYIEAASAVRHMMAWIRQHPELVDALKASGYRPRQRNLSPQQVSLILEHLGEP